MSDLDLVLPKSQNKLFTALAQFQKQVKAIPKTGRNPHFRSNYAELDTACNYLYPLMGEHGLSIVHLGYVEGEWLMLKTILAHSSGEKIESEWPVAKLGAKPQEIGSATTYARRYALLAITGLSAEEEDDDAELAHGRLKAAATTTANVAPVVAKPAKTNDVAPEQAKPAGAVGLSLKQVNRMYAIAKANKWPVAYVQAYVRATYKKAPEQLSRQAYEQACEYFSAAIFDEGVKASLKDHAPMGGNVMEAFEKAKKSGGYVDHTQAPMPTEPPPFDDDQIPF